MANNKFIERLKGQPTAGSLVEIKNTSAKTSFANMPVGSSNAVDVFSDHRNNATIVANGTLLWKVDGETLESVESVFGDGKDFSSVQSVAGSGLWVNASYTFPSTGDPNHPIAMVFNPNIKWVLKLCGDNLIVDGGNVVDFTLIVKIGSAHIFSKNFKVAENAGQFSTEFILDFEETNTGIVKAGGLAKLTLQLLCGTENASARIYNGMTVLTCLQRKVDASAVSSTNANVQDVLDGNIVPDDYFSNPEFIDQIEDGKDAYAVFNRDGDSVILSGWTPKEDVATASQLNTEIQNRISADDALGLRIDNEVTARESADNALGARIDNVINDLTTETTVRENADTALQGQITSNKNAIDAHVADTSNPHNVTKAQVGLGNVDNTSDLDKPISTATQTALDLKADKSTTYTKNETDTLLGAKQDTISDLSTIRSNAQAGKAASDTIATYGNIVTHNVSEFATATQGAKADTAVQPADLATVATSGSYNDLSDKPTIPTVGNGTITITQGGITKGAFTTNQSGDTTVELDGGGSSVDIDNLTITENASNEIQAVAVVNQNSGVLKSWTGTLVEYNALETKSDDTMYVITDDDSEGVNVYTKSEVDDLLNNKQDTLVSGTNIKTINGETLLGSGNIKIEAGSSGSDYVIEYQMPTAENNYTWYRKYKSDWVEQGGCIPQGSGAESYVEFPIPMATVHNPIWISIQTVADVMVNFNDIGVVDVTNTGFSCYESDAYDKYWKTEGVAA